MARFFLIEKSVLTRYPNAMLLRAAIVAVYAVIPKNSVLTPDPERIPATAVDVITSKAVGPQSIQCLAPKETEFAIRMWSRVIAATKRRHVCLIVTMIHSRMAEPGSVARATPEGPAVDSLIVCHMKRTRATRSRLASHRWLLSAGERDRKVGSPNSAYNGKFEPVIFRAKKRTHR
jgi:hypothetical protein